MSKSQSNRISKLLRAIADNLEVNPDFLKQLEVFMMGNKSENNEVSNVPIFDIWTVQSQEGKDKLKIKLEDLSLSQLVKIIQYNALDPSKLSHKWKTKDKLVALIMDRVSDRINKGNIFYEYGKSEENKTAGSGQDEIILGSKKNNNNEQDLLNDKSNTTSNDQ